MSHHRQAGQHAQFVRQARERIEVAYLKAKRNGADDCVVLLIDPHDKKGRRIVEESGRGEEIDSRVSHSAREGLTAYITWGMPRELAVDLLRPWLIPCDLEILVHFTFNGYMVIIVSDDHYSFALLPCVPLDSDDCEPNYALN